MTRRTEVDDDGDRDCVGGLRTYDSEGRDGDDVPADYGG